MALFHGDMPNAFKDQTKTEFALLIKDVHGIYRDTWSWMSDATAARAWSAWQSKQPLTNGDVILGIVKAPMIWTKTP